MDDVLCRKVITLCDFCVARFASTKCAAFFKQFRAGGAVNGSIHPAATKQGLVGCVCYSLDIQYYDVVLDYFYHDQSVLE